jgi:hypothetical protein
VELSIPYEITGPDGARAVFGNSDAARLDPDWCGYLDPDNGITGLLDGADVRESSAVVPQGDGGLQGAHWLGLRPGTINGMLDPNWTRAAQEVAIQKIKRATRALRADAVMRWTPSSDGIERMLRLRRTARSAFGGRRPTTYQLAMTSRDAYVLASDESSVEITPGSAAGELGIADPVTDPVTSALNVTAQQYAQNLGDAATWPRFRVDGPITNPEILSQTTGQRIRLVYTLNAGEWLDVYPQRGAILLGGSADRYGALDFDVSDWWLLQPGLNDVRLLAAAYTVPGAKLTVYWRHAWE